MRNRRARIEKFTQRDEKTFFTAGERKDYYTKIQAPNDEDKELEEIKEESHKEISFTGKKPKFDNERVERKLPKAFYFGADNLMKPTDDSWEPKFDDQREE